MTILFPTASYFPSQLGGPSNTIYWHCCALKKRGINTIITTTSWGILEKHKIGLNTWITNESGKVYYSSLWFGIPINQIFQTLRLIPKADVIQLSSIFYYPSLIFAIWGLICKKKIVWSPRGEFEKSALFFGKAKKEIYLKLLKIIYNKNITFHATSISEQGSIQKMMNEKANVICLPNYLPTSVPLRIEKNNNKAYFLYIGRIHPIKGLENLIKALEDNSTFLHSELQFLIYGKPQNILEEEHLLELTKLVESYNLSQKIVFKGYVEGQEKNQLYANAYFFILPSFSENFGNVVVEALSQGTPVITTKGTPWEVLDEKKAGFWVSNDIENLSEAITLALDLEEDIYQKFRINALDLVKNSFSIENNIQKWVDIYQELLN